MDIQTVLSSRVQQLIDVVLGSGMGFFVVPFLIMFSIVRFLRWMLSTSRGSPDIEDIQESAVQLRGQAERTQANVARTFRRRY